LSVPAFSIAGQFRSSYEAGTDKISFLFLLQVSLDPPIKQGQTKYHRRI
jgi:hypothetical protein